MGSSYMIRLKLKKKITGRKKLMELVKKILTLKDFVDKLDVKYEKSKIAKTNIETVDGTIVLSRNKFSSLYESASKLDFGHNSDFYQSKSKKYTVNFSLFRIKKGKTVTLKIEDFGDQLYYKHSHKRLKIVSLKKPIRLFKIYLNFSKPEFMKRDELNLGPLWISFDPLKKINKYIEKNCEAMIEFVKKLVELYDPETAEVGTYSNTSDSLAPTVLEYSKKDGFKINQKTLFKD